MDKSSAIRIEPASTPGQLDEVRKLIHAFVRWHRQRHTEDLALIDEYFDVKAFEEELQSLPGKYAPPQGQLLLALWNGQPAGCVAFRQLDDKSCEMKRMFVYEPFHGKGVGMALAEAIVRDAGMAGYASMKLDTSVRQLEAVALYEKIGFRRTQPYYNLPKKLEDWLVFMELDLHAIPR